MTQATERIYQDAIKPGREHRLLPGGGIEERHNGGEWVARDAGPHNPRSCWCAFAIAPLDDSQTGGNEDMSRGRNWERIYTCRTCVGRRHRA